MAGTWECVGPWAFPEELNALDENCDGVADDGLIPSGAVIVTEVMADPAAVLDSEGEWFELYNAWTNPIALRNWIVSKDSATSDERFAISLPATHVLPPGSSLVLCSNGDAATNGGVTCDATWTHGSTLGTLELANSSDHLNLILDGSIMERVAWTSTTSGTSWSLDAAKYDATANDAEANWCSAAAPMPGGDLGSPGAANPICP